MEENDKKYKILVVEDEEELLNLYMMRIKIESFDVISASNGEEALEKAREEKPDIVLLDIMLPGKSGLDVLKELKQDPNTKNIKIIMLTALVQDKVKKQALELGAEEFLAKANVLASDIVNTIKRVLEAKA